MVRPFVALVLLTLAWGIAKGLNFVIPEGPMKRFLYKPRRLY